MPGPSPAPVSVSDHALAYIALGWGLCSIPRGTKGPTDDDWNSPALVIDTREKALAVCQTRPDNGLGLVHASSGTCALDVDHVDYFRTCLSEFGLDFDELLSGAPRIIGKEGRDKAIFRVPDGFDGKMHRLVWPKPSGSEKPVTIFELRCGAVQDVLPPTIHPDTKRPYRWREGCAPWDIDRIPKLPAQLRAMWEAWDSFKPQLLALCPWAERPPAPKPRVRTITAHQNVIGQFNEAHDLCAMLDAHGYKRVGRRYLSPTSESKLAGVVVFEDGTHCYSHHASDPLNDGHAHDAFDLFCVLDHGGDLDRAVRSAAEILHIQRLPDLPVIDPAALIESAKRKREAKAASIAAQVSAPTIDPTAVPGEITRIPGALGHLVDHMVASAIKPQRVLSVTGALAFGAVMMAQIYASITDLRTNLYLLGVAPSTAGKDHARRVVKAALAACGKKDRIGGEDIKSGPAVLSAVHRCPAVLFQLDEFGLFLQAVMSPKAGSFQADIARQLMMLRTSANTIVAGAEYADQRNRPRLDIEYPCAVLHGTTTGDAFWPALSSKHVLSGFLNRFIVTHSENPSPERQMPSRRANDIPEAVLEWAAAIQSREGKQAGNLQGFSPAVPCIVGETASGSRQLEAFARTSDARAAELLGTGLDSLWGRAAAMATEVAMIVAGSINPSSPIIDDVAAGWSVQFVDYWTQRLVVDVSSRIVDTEFEALCQAVARVLRNGSTPDRSYSEREIGLHWRGWKTLKPFQRDEVMAAIVRNGDAIEIKRKGARGPVTRAWIAREFAPENLIPEDAAA